MKKIRDQAAIDALIARFFAAFDNRHGAVPEISKVSSCFTDKAIIVRHSKAVTDLYTVAEFALPRVALLNGGTLLDFYELETDATTQLFDGIALRTSRYRKSGLLDGQEYHGIGTKCFQLVELNEGWRIASLAWVDDPA